MDYIQKNKILIGAIVVLVVLNVAIVTFMLLSRPTEPPGPRDQRRDQVARFIEDELKFSPEQQAQYRQLRKEFFSLGDSMMQARAETMEELFILLKSDSPDPDRIREKAALVGATETGRAIATWDHFRALRALCTKDQRERFDHIVLDVLRQARGPEPGNGPGGPPPQGQGHPPGQGRPVGEGPDHPDGPGHPGSEPPGPPPGGPDQWESPRRE